MTSLSVVTIALGVFVVMARGPLIFAPTRTVAAYRRALDTTMRIRALGVGIGVLGLGLVLLARESAEPAAQLVEVLGALITGAVVVLLLMLPSLYRRLALDILDAAEQARLLRPMAHLQPRTRAQNTLNIVTRGQKNQRNIPCGLFLFQKATGLIPVHLRHHHIHQNKIGS